MAFTVHDFRDLVHLLEQRPEWREELRRLVLTEDLLGLPQIVRELAEAQWRTEETVRGLAERVDQLAQRMDQLTQRMDQLAERMDTMGRSMDRLVEVVEKLGADVGKIKGHDIERQYRERAPVYFGRVIRRGRALTYDELYRLLDAAVAQGQLTEEESDEIVLADAVVRGRRVEDQETVYLVVEASWGVGTHDVERAVKRAALLAKAGVVAVPVVAGEWVTPEGGAMARSWKVWQVTDGRTIAPEAA